MNELNNNSNSLESGAENKNINFENTSEGQKLLNSINPAFRKIRQENEYNGEARIMQHLSRKHDKSSLTEGFVAEFNSSSNNKDQFGRTDNNENIIIPPYQRKEGFIRTTPPKN